MAISTTGITPAANFLPTVWSRHLTDATQSATVLSDLVDRKYEAEMKMGRIINIQDISNPAVRFKTEDASATWANINETRQQITVDLQAYVAFLVENIAELQANISLREEYTSKSGYSLMATVEGHATSGLASLPANFSQILGTLGSDPTDDDWLRAIQYLDDGDVPDDGRFIYCAPPVYISLLKNEKFTKASYVGQASAERAIKKARVGDIYNCGVHRSTLANNTPSAANQSYAWVCHREGVALIIQQKPVTHVQFVILEDGWGVLSTLIYKFAERKIPPSTLGGGTPDDRFNVTIQAA